MQSALASVGAFLLAALVLFLAASLLWLLSELAAGKERFILHIGNVLLATVVGLALFPFWGWRSTGLVLAGFGGLWMIGALVDRWTSADPGAHGGEAHRSGLSRAEAERRVLERINRPGPGTPDKPEFVLLPEATIERPWGWVFFYDSQQHRATGRPADRLAGNAPCLVNRETGEVVFTGTAHPIEHYIREYEAKLDAGA